MASALMTGVLGGIAGGANKYNEIKDEQRKHTLRQAEQDAQFKRQQNLARFQKQISGSGMYSPEGMEYTREEFGNLTSEGQQGALSKFDMEGQNKLSQWVEKDTGLRLTEKQVKDRDSMEGLVTVNEYANVTQEQKEIRAETRREIRSKEKEKETLRKEKVKKFDTMSKAFSKDIQANLEAETLGETPKPEDIIKAQVDAYKAAKSAYSGEDLEEFLKDKPNIRKSIEADKAATDLADAMREGLPYSEALNYLKKQGYAGDAGKAIIAYMKKQGVLSKNLTDKMLGLFGSETYTVSGE